MANDERDRVIRAVSTLLERELNCLLRGDLASLATLAGEKEVLVAQLRATGAIEPALFADLREKVIRNQDLLDAALHGIRRASARLAAYRQLRKEMATYDPQGRKATIPGAVLHRLERRA
ncbi:flagellar protein FlgN [Roseovarius autotrophicus]|uniref:flagellar protein FlgN n=1 Tax=Roseovarius autotrophicus TaxID=2824121 RepID=UPI0019EE20AF|nr:flagellar protein FlgN [Roseovarius autotrophicus]MBE0455471.1 flagellar protein FlgN [Roseovarius sp.]